MYCKSSFTHNTGMMLVVIISLSVVLSACDSSVQATAAPTATAPSTSRPTVLAQPTVEPTATALRAAPTPRPTGQPVLYGPALDTSPDPLRASLTFEVEVAARDKNLTLIVDAYMGQFAKLPVPPIQRTTIQFGGEPAEVLEGVPGRGGSRDALKSSVKFRP